MLIFQKITIFWGFFCNVIRQREYYFLSKIAQLSLIFFRKKSSYTFDIFQPTFLLLETFIKSLSITLKSTIFSLHIYSKKRSKKNIIGKNIKTYCTMKYFCHLCKRKENRTLYRIVAGTNTCYYSENQVFGGVTTRDMSLNKTCFYS